MKPLARIALLAAVLLASPIPAGSQYLYLDANGDGINTAADFLNGVGSATVVDVWLQTDHTKYGFPVACDTQDGALSIRSYTINLAASGGTVGYSGFVNRIDAFTEESVPFATNSGQMTVGRSLPYSVSPLPAGKYRLCTITITVSSFFAAVIPVPYTDVGPDPCGFGTQCSGNDFDNVYKLGSDWFDMDGASTGIVDDFGTPSIAAPTQVSSVEGRTLTIVAVASDPDVGSHVTLTETGAPASLTYTVTTAPLSARGELQGTLAFDEAGSYTIRWTGSDGFLDVQATTMLSVADSTPVYPMTAFTVGGNRTTVLGSGKPYTCVQIQPVGAAYANADVIPTSIRLIYPVGTGNTIFADVLKGLTEEDRNSDGIAEVAACFRKGDLRALFSGLPAGTNTVTVELRGDLSSGGGFRTTMEMTVKTGRPLAVSVSPNPLNPRATLTFATTRPGSVRVQMLDAQGRLVKSIVDGVTVAAGDHAYVLEGRSDAGAPLASGVYFVRVWSQFDGSDVERVTIVK